MYVRLHMEREREREREMVMVMMMILYHVRDLDEALKARVMLDVDSMELNAFAPWLRGFKQVLDLVAVDINGEHCMLSFPHQFLAEVRSDESTSSDHTDGERRNGVPVKVETRSRRRIRSHGWVLKKKKKGKKRMKE